MHAITGDKADKWREARALTRAWLTESFNSHWRYGRKSWTAGRLAVYLGGFVWAAWRLRALLATGAIPGLNARTLTSALAVQLFFQAFFASVMQTRQDLYTPARVETALVTPAGGEALMIGRVMHGAAKALASAVGLTLLLVSTGAVPPALPAGALGMFLLAGFAGQSAGVLVTLLLVRVMARAAAGIHFLMAVLQVSLLGAVGWLLQRGGLNLEVWAASAGGVVGSGVAAGAAAAAVLVGSTARLVRSIYLPGYQRLNVPAGACQYKPRWMTWPGRGFAAALRAMANRELLLQSRSPIFIARVLFFSLALVGARVWAVRAGLTARADVAMLVPLFAYLISFGELHAASFQGEGGRIAILVTSPQPLMRVLAARAVVQAAFAALLTAVGSVALALSLGVSGPAALLLILIGSATSAFMSVSLLSWGVLAVNPDRLPTTAEEDMIAEQAIASLPALVGIAFAVAQVAAVALAVSPMIRVRLGLSATTWGSWVLPVVVNAVLPATAWGAARTFLSTRFRRAV